MFGNKNNNERPIVKLRTISPGNKAIIVSTGKEITVIARGNGNLVSVSDGKNSWNASGEIAVWKV